ncbi:Tobamovirus multiplication protein 1, partial [Cucurbita argyrosperma subsp. argyrosperma]
MVRDLVITSAVGGFEWWNQIDESEDWQKGIYYTLSASYGLISIIALVQLIRIQVRVPEFEWTTQKGFHLMNFVVNGLRAILFGLYKSVFLIRPKALEMVVMEVPGLLFFSTYTLLVLFWAEIYYQARSLPIDRLKPTYCIINGVIYVIQVGCVTTICFTCFFIRCFVLAFSAFDKDADLDVLDHPILNLIYYMASFKIP